MKNSFFFLVILITLVFFLPTLSYSVKLYDELNIIKENYLPICSSLSEMIELIKNVGLNNYVESTNTLYSNIYSLRCNPFGNLLQLVIQTIYKNNTFLYHLYSVCLHLISTAFVFLILNKVSLIISRNNKLLTHSLRLTVVSILSLLWALHPANIESILLITNANIVLSYALVLTALYLYISSYSEELNYFDLKIKHHILIVLCYLPALFIAEFHFLLPLILVSYSFAILHSSGYSTWFKCLRKSIFSTLPFILCSTIFITLFLLSNTGANLTIYNNEAYNNFQLMLERVFWLAPQVIVHLIKLVLAPIKLSVDQSHFVIFGKTLFDPYAIFCIIFLITIITASFISIARSKLPLLYILIIPFLISLLPFSHAIAPIYNIASERYLYLPSFIFIFGLAHCIIYYLAFYKNTLVKSAIPTLAIVLLIFSLRAQFRKVEWEDNISLYKSAISATDNPLFKAMRYKGLTPQDRVLIGLPEFEVDPKYRELAAKHLQKAIKKYGGEKKAFQKDIPNILKSYGLDPATLYAKTGYYQAQTDFTVNTNPKQALAIMKKYTDDIALLDSAAASFYASLLFYNDEQDKAEQVLRDTYKKYPYSTRVIFPLAEVIYHNSEDLEEPEKLIQKAFKFYPYDNMTLEALIKIYNLTEDLKKYAHYSYIAGLRRHSPQKLRNAEVAFFYTKDMDNMKRARDKIEELNAKSQ